MRKLQVKLFGIAALLLAGVATAGLSSNITVTITNNADGTKSAKGALKAVRASANNVEAIGVSKYSYGNGNTSINCYAVNSAGTAVSCGTSDPDMMRAAEALNGSSYLYFIANADGTCKQVIVSTYSYYL